MKTLLTSLMMLMLSANYSLAQNAPAAMRGMDGVVQETYEPNRGDVVSEEVQFGKEELKPSDKKGAFKKRKKRARIGFDWDEFGTIFFGILGFLVWLGGLAAFFWFGSLGWWVLLIALGGIIVGTGIMFISAAIDGGRLAGLGPAFMFIFGMIGWLFGLLVISIIEAFN